MKPSRLSLGPIFLAATLFAVLSGCSPQSGASTPTASNTPGPTTLLEIEHSRGKAELSASPQRVVVFDLASLDTLDTLEVPVHGVAGKLFPKHLEKYAASEYVKVGTLFEPDYEVLNSAKPDLIIVGGRSAAKYDELIKLAPTIDLSLKEDNYLGSAKSNAQQLGKLFGKSEIVEHRLARLQSTTDALSSKTKSAGKALVVLTTGGKMSAYGPGSRFGIIYSDFGFAPAADNLSTGRHGEPISFEFIAKTNPDWLFVVDRDAAIGETGQSAAALLDNSLVKQSSASQKGQIIYLNPTNWYLAGGGLSTLQAMADEVSRAVGIESP